MKKLRVLILLILSFYSLSIYSQNIIEGQISYSNDLGENTPLIGVSIYWKDTSIGTLSDIDGKFKISKTNLTNELIFKFLGLMTN